MFTRKVGQLFALAVILTAVCASVNAENKVYKWVDEDGVVHFSDTPPAESSPAETDIITIPKSEPNTTAVQAAAETPAVSATVDEMPSDQPVTKIAAPVPKIDITKMSIAELDLRCDNAREEKIAPLRQAEIANCKQNKSNDPAWCERFNADFGDGGRTVSGSVRPRMFDDLPECVEALQENNRRGR